MYIVYIYNTSISLFDKSDRQIASSLTRRKKKPPDENNTTKTKLINLHNTHTQAQYKMDFKFIISAKKVLNLGIPII